MTDAPPTTIDALKAALRATLPISEFRGADARRRAARASCSTCCELLKDERGFDLLVDVTCVDYLNYRDATDRFGLVYLLANTDDQRAADGARVRRTSRT